MILAFSILIFLAVVVATARLGPPPQRRGAVARCRGDSRVSPSARAGFRAPEVERDKRYSAIPCGGHAAAPASTSRQALEMLLYQAGMSMRVGVLLAADRRLRHGRLPLRHHRLPPGGPGACCSCCCSGRFRISYVRYRKYQRMKAFAAEFPDSLDLLVSALRAGLSFSAAMQIVAEESPEPVRGEFAITVEEQSLGLDFRESLLNLTRRVDSLDLRFFVTAVVLQRETGGNLAEILENTARLIRDRFRILGDIQTFTAQGRLTGAILLCLPIAASACSCSS